MTPVPPRQMEDCPFCGSAADAKTNNHKFTDIICSNKDCLVRPVICGKSAKVISAWNTRTAARVEDVIKAADWLIDGLWNVIHKTPVAGLDERMVHWEAEKKAARHAAKTEDLK